MGEALEVMREGLAVLGSTGAPFMLVGATAIGVYTLPRASYDVDFLVDAGARDRLKGRFSHVEETADLVFGQNAWVVEMAGRVAPLELFFASHWFTLQALTRRRWLNVPALGGQVPVGTPEDLLLLKAANAVHPSRVSYKRATDLTDVGALLATQRGLDHAYLRVQARALGDAVASYLRDAGVERL